MVSAQSSSSKSEACLLQDFPSLPVDLKLRKPFCELKSASQPAESVFCFCQVSSLHRPKEFQCKLTLIAAFAKLLGPELAFVLSKVGIRFRVNFERCCVFFLLLWRTPRLTCGHVQICQRQMKSCHPECDKDVAET